MARESHLLGIICKACQFLCILMDSGSISVMEGKHFSPIKGECISLHKAALKRLRRRMDFPSDGYRPGYPLYSPAWQYIWAPEWHLGPVGLTWGHRFALSAVAFLLSPQAFGQWPCPLAGDVTGRMRDTPTWLAKWMACFQLPGPEPGCFCTTTYEFSKGEEHSDYELSRRKRSSENKWQWDKNCE